MLLAFLALIATLVGLVVLRSDQEEGAEAIGPQSEQGAVGVRLADPFETYDPVRAGEPLPEGYRPLLSRDDIDPVYDPQFVRAEEVDWAPETLVVGLAVGNDARAYPVNYLNVHEMVNDRVGGIPVLVSW